MIEVLLKDCGVWVEVYRDDNLSSSELAAIARDCGLEPEALDQAEMPDLTRVHCAKTVAVRFRK